MDKRMLTEKEAMEYTSLGRNSVRKLGKELDCVRHFGNRIMYDRKKIDAFLDGTIEAVTNQ